MTQSSRPVDPEELLANAGWLRTLARGLVGDAHLAEDVVQQSLTTAIERPPRPGVPLRAWLARVARNLSLNAMRSRSRRSRHESAAGAPPPPTPPEESAARAEMLREAFDAVMALDTPLRDVVLARFFDGLDWPQTARRLGVPVETARTRMKRAMSLLRERLDRRFGNRAAWVVALGSWDRSPPPGGTVAVPSGPGGAVAAAAGGAVMGTAAKAAAVGTIVLLAGAGWWAAGSLDGPEDAEESQEEIAVAAGDAAGTRRAARPDSDELDATGRAASAEFPAPVDLGACDRDLDLCGRVVDEVGQPIAGAAIETSRDPWKRLGAWRGEFPMVRGPATKTARDGTFAVRLARGTSVDLRVAANGFGEIVRTDCLAGERVEVTLPRGATLVVTAVDERDRPVADVEVLAWRNNGGSQQFVPIRQRFEATTGADGVARVGGLLAGVVLVRAEHATLGAPRWQTVRVPAAGEVPLRLTMPAGRTVRGRVTETETGRAILGARVGAGSVLERAVRTDAEGRYEFAGWTDSGMGILTAQAPGRLSRWSPVGDSEVLDFALEPAGAASGRIVGPDGAAAPSACVVVRSQWIEGRSSVVITALADGEGRFSVEGLDPGRPHTLVAAQDGVGRALVAFDAPAAAGAPLALGDVRLAVARSIEGVAADAEGAPLAEVNVTLVGPLDPREDASAERPGAMPVAETRRTDDLGRFRFPDVTPGTYEVSLFLTDAPRSEPVRVLVPTDADVRDVAVRLPGSRTLPIRVTDESGDPIEGAYVQLNGDFGWRGGSVQPVTLGTDASGRARARGLPASETSVFVSADSRKDLVCDAIAPLVPDGKELHVVLRRADEVRGVVLDGDGRPVPGIRVEAVPRAPGGTEHSGESDEEGRFAVRVTAGETVDLVVSGLQAHRTKHLHRVLSTPWRGRLDGITAPAAGLVMRLSREGESGGRALVVVVLDVAGNPLAENDVSVVPVGGGAGGFGITGRDGSVRIGNLPEGESFVRVGAPYPREGVPSRLEVPPAAVTVTPEGQTVNLRCRPAVPIRGRVADDAGEPAREVYVTVSAADGTPAHARTDRDGRFVAPGLPGVAHSLACAIRRPDGSTLRGSVSDVVPDASNGADGVVIRLEPSYKSER